MLFTLPHFNVTRVDTVYVGPFDSPLPCCPPRYPILIPGPGVNGVCGRSRRSFSGTFPHCVYAFDSHRLTGYYHTWRLTPPHTRWVPVTFYYFSHALHFGFRGCRYAAFSLVLRYYGLVCITTPFTGYYRLAHAGSAGSATAGHTVRTHTFIRFYL